MHKFKIINTTSCILGVQRYFLPFWANIPADILLNSGGLYCGVIRHAGHTWLHFLCWSFTCYTIYSSVLGRHIKDTSSSSSSWIYLASLLVNRTGKFRHNEKGGKERRKNNTHPKHSLLRTRATSFYLYMNSIVTPALLLGPAFMIGLWRSLRENKRL